MIVDAYTPGVIVPKSQSFQYDFDLITNVLATKQQQFDTAFIGLEHLKRQALNIQFLNTNEQEKVDQFNSRINQFFSSLNGEYGDLSNPQILSAYTALYDEVGGDEQLIQRFRQDQLIRQEAMAVEEKRTSDDPEKAGFHPINYTNYLRRLQDYRDADLDKGPVTVQPYTNYVDINKEIAGLVRQVPIKKWTETVRDGNGYIRQVTYEGRDPNAVQQAVTEYMQSKGAPQVRELAEYYFHNSVQTPADKEFLYQQYRSHIDPQVAQLQASVDDLQARIPSLTGEELTQATSRLGVLETQLSGLRGRQYSLEEYMSRDTNQYIEDMFDIEMRESIMGYTDTFGGYSVSTDLKPDNTYLEFLKLEQRALELAEESRQFDIENSGSAETNAGGVNASGITFAATNDPTQVDMSSTVEALRQSLQSTQILTADPFAAQGLFAATTEGLEQSLWRGEAPPADLSNNAYVEAYRKAVDDARMARMPEAQGIEYARQEARRILQNPRDAQEVEIYNLHQDNLANELSLRNVMQQANQSGDPNRFMDRLNSIWGFSYGRTPVDPDLWQNKDDREVAVAYRNQIWNGVLNHISFNAPDNVSREFRGMELADRFSPDLIEVVELRGDGTVTLQFNDKAFDPGTGEEGESGYRAPGPLYNRYYTVEQDGMYTATKFEGNTLTVNVPEMAMQNLHRNLGIYIDNTPQTRYALNKTGTPVAFDIYRNRNNQFVYKIYGYQDTPAVSTLRNPEAVINTIRNRISTFDDPT